MGVFTHTPGQVGPLGRYAARRIGEGAPFLLGAAFF